MNRQEQERKLRLALGVISGRISPSDDDMETLGYDPYKFGYFGRPSSRELQQKAEDVIVESILSALYPNSTEPQP